MDKVERLIKKLKSWFWWSREHAARALGEIKDQRAIEPLITALRDKDGYVRKAAAEALGKIEPNWANTEVAKNQVPEFIAALRDEDYYIQNDAKGVLVKIGKPAVEPLIFALKDKNWSVRMNVASAIGEIKDPRALEPFILEPFIVALRDKDEYVRERAREPLNKIEPNWANTEAAKNQVPEFIAALKDGNHEVREAAAKALGKIGDIRAVEPLSVALRDNSNAAKQALVRIGALAVEFIIPALKDENRDVREAAAEVLGKIKDQRAVEPLITALRDEWCWVRRKAAEAVGEIKDPRAVEHLILLLKDNYVQSEAIQALDKIEPNWANTEAAKNQVPEFIAALKDGNHEVREAAAKALGKIGDIRAVEPLISCLKDPCIIKYDGGMDQSEYVAYVVREAAANALGGIKDQRAVEPLIAALRDTDSSNLQSAIIYALANIGKSAVEPLIATLSDKHSNVRYAAANALGVIKDQRAVEPLIAALRDKHVDVRMYAAEALGKIKDPRAVEPLIAVLRNENGYVRKHAAEALGEIEPNWTNIESAKNQLPKFIAALRDEDSNVRKSVATALEKRIKSNLPFLEIYPNLFCSSCFLKPRKRSIRAEIFKSYFFVYCRGCGSSLNLIKDIKQVIGLIGGDIKDYRVDGDRVYVNLWDETQKKARNADIDLLEIREPTESLSYDLAISTVLTVLKTDVSRKSEYVKKIPVIITGNPQITENSRRLLQYEFGGIK